MQGDVYLGTPKGQSLRSLKAAERWLGLATPTDAASTSATASGATAAGGGGGGSTASAAAAAALASYLTEAGAVEPEAEAEPGTVRDGLEALLHEARRYLVITPSHPALLHEARRCLVITPSHPRLHDVRRCLVPTPRATLPSCLVAGTCSAQTVT